MIVYFALGGIAIKRFVAKDAALYNHDQELLGEFQDGRFVPSTLLLNKSTRYQDQVEDWIRLNQYKGIVDGMTVYEANQVLSYAQQNLGAWADFTLSERTEADAKPGFPAGIEVNYIPKIEFHSGQAVEVKAYLNGFLAGLRWQNQGQ